MTRYSFLLLSLGLLILGACDKPKPIAKTKNTAVVKPLTNVNVNTNIKTRPAQQVPLKNMNLQLSEDYKKHKARGLTYKGSLRLMTSTLKVKKVDKPTKK